MRISPKGLALIRKWEGLYLTAYLDPVNVWTIGYGTINNAQLGLRVYPGQRIDRASAIMWKQIELDAKGPEILRRVKVPLNQNQFDTLQSFVYNVGIGNFERSTLLRQLNRGNYDAVPGQMMRFVTARDRKTGVRITLRGLKNRREDEVRMWNGHPISGLKVEPAIDKNKYEIDKPLVNPNAGKALPNSHTVRVSTGVIGSVWSWAVQNPDTVGLAMVITVLSAYIIWRKWRDIREYAG